VTANLFRWLPTFARTKRQRLSTRTSVDDSHNEASRSSAVIADNPIRTCDEDALGRAPVARSFADHLLSLDASEGVVVGILGPWGSGKTSFVNLTRGHLEGKVAAVLDFNPWMFSGAEQLLACFFKEVSAQLKLRPSLNELGASIEQYGDAFVGMSWLPVVGPWVERGRAGAKLLARVFQQGKGGLGARRDSLAKTLAALTQPLVIVVDDIDRLALSEVRDIFRLVRLTASFPNVIYVLAFDRGRVETALADQGVSGRDYLEKILQVVIDLPATPPHVLQEQVLLEIQKSISSIDNPGQFDQSVWPDVFMEVIRPLVRNMRDVRRYSASARGTVLALDGQIALADVLALEAIRVFLPDVFTKLFSAVGALTATSAFAGRRQEAVQEKEQIAEMITDAKGHGDIVRALVRHLFPAGLKHIARNNYGSEWEPIWLRARRVAHRDVLRLYLERVAGAELSSFTDAEQAWVRMASAKDFGDYLASLNTDRLRSVIASLEFFEGDFEANQVAPGAVVLLNLLPRMPVQPRGVFELDDTTVVTRVVYRLVRSLKTEASIQAALPDMLSQVNTLSSKLTLITIVGHRENAGHKLVTDEFAKQLEKQWRAEVRAGGFDRLVTERDLIRILLCVNRDADASEPRLDIPDSPRVTLAVLQAARTEMRSQAMGSRVVRRSSRLAWDALISIFGGEETLLQRIGNLMLTKPSGCDELLDLAIRYSEGWRPDQRDDE
jgi:hypothetical protein